MNFKNIHIDSIVTKYILSIHYMLVSIVFLLFIIKSLFQ